MKKLFSFFLALFILPVAMSADGLVINELMQSNVNCLYVDNEFPDSWVELYNASNKTLNIKGYGIGGSEKHSKAYLFTHDILIPANSYTVVYCDKDDYGMHANFRVESGKGGVYLFNPMGEIIDQVTFAKMPAPDVAYGRERDNGSEWGYMVMPTPGSSNVGGVTSAILPLPIFSEKGGLKSEPFVLSITISDEELPEDVQLCVTLDGREPTADDVVMAPFEINVDTTTVVRAKLLSHQAVSPLSQTHSYIFYEQSLSEPLPVVSIVTNNDYLYDPEWGILGIPMEDGQNANVEWRRPINIEYFENDETLFNQIGETRVQGNWSRRYAQRSLAVYANKRFGVKRFEGAVWKDKPNVDEFKSFTLRNSGNDFAGAHIRDAFTQTLAGRHCDNLDWMAYQPCVCFINGVYKGIYDVRERSNEDYIEANYDGLEDIEMIENWHEEKVGSVTALDELFAAVNDTNVTFEQIDALVDIEELNNNFVINSFITNTDYPFNNHIIWRDITEENSKWQFVMKDMDRTAYEEYDFDYFTFLYDYYNQYQGEYHNLASGLRLYTLILENEQLRNLFIDRYIVYMGDFLQCDVAVSLLETMREEYAGEYRNHCMVYFADPDSQMEAWDWHYRHMKLWWGNRMRYMTYFLGHYFQIGPAVPVTINTEGYTVKVNDIELTQDTFNGAFYAGRKMTLVAENVDKEYGWLLVKYYSDGTYEKCFIVEDSIDVLVDKNMESMSIELNFNNSIDNITEGSTQVVVSDSNITLQASQPLQRVVLYDMQGRTVSQEQLPRVYRHNIAAVRGGIYLLHIYYANGLAEVKKVVVR